MRRTRPLRIRVSIGAALMASVALAAVAPSPALAGTHGQQVDTVVAWPIQWFQICGYNQYNTWKCTPIYPTGAAPGEVVHDPVFYWWWQGKIKIWGWVNYDRYQPARTRYLAYCRVPSGQQDNDWTTCDEATLVKRGWLTTL